MHAAERDARSAAVDRSLDPLWAVVYRVLGWTFAVVGAVFFLFPDGTIAALNRAGSWLGFTPAPFTAQRFWLSLGVAYMAVVTVLAFSIARAPSERRLLLVPLAAGKATSSVTCLWFFVTDAPYFIYLANFLTDASLAVLAWCTYVATSTPPTALPPRARRVLEAVAEALFPPSGSTPRLSSAALADAVEEQLRSFGPLALRGFSLLLRFVDWNPRLFHWQRNCLSALPWQERVPLLEAMEASRWGVRRQAIHLLKLLLGLQAYPRPELRLPLFGGDRYLEEKLAAARARRERGEKGPYPQPLTLP